MNDSVITALFDAAALVRQNAYAPYSGFAVGAALRANNGRIYRGCNVENAAYPSGTCAEEAAIAAMIADGAKQIEMIAILGDSRAPVMPCGACRQRIHEFATPSTMIHAGNLAGARKSASLADILPDSFGAGSLST
mgnify:CR=1 FL=1